uniref:Uncharacterized protein n=1 Tax=Rousettus aegyptiacus TaxID=9407 RepID=A0A7J8H1H7_ROUAE|nr:hypothetical protein HJG63_011351 [Rousettus aegyptiacus]
MLPYLYYPHSLTSPTPSPVLPNFPRNLCKACGGENICTKSEGARQGAPTTKRRPDEFSKQSSNTQDTPHPLPHAFCNVAAHVHLPVNPCHNYPFLITILPPSITHSALSLRCPSHRQWLCSLASSLLSYIQVANISFPLSYPYLMPDSALHSACRAGKQEEILPLAK